MRIAVVGATGNLGTAVLRALHDAPDVDSILGVARRLPDRDAEPYAGVDWASIDIGGETSRQEATDALTEAFRGVDAVIHLAWLIQPNRQRDLLRRVNVEGTRHVATAAANAGVAHLVAVSSLGAYSPDDGDGARDESWPTGGVPTSHYAVDKAAQERVLDGVEAAHPGLLVTRLRPGLVFDADAASEIRRYFLGSLVPPALVRPGVLPLLPLPAGIRVQIVHGEDLGRACVAAVRARVGGAFNVCADDVLRARDLAGVLDHGRFVEVPRAVVRTAVAAAYDARLVPADPGWLDMAYAVPELDNTRAREVLGWKPRHTAAEALEELLEAMAEGRGAASPPMRPARCTSMDP